MDLHAWWESAPPEQVQDYDTWSLGCEADELTAELRDFVQALPGPKRDALDKLDRLDIIHMEIREHECYEEI